MLVSTRLWHTELKNARPAVWVDSQAAMRALTKGYSGAAALNQMAKLNWLDMAIAADPSLGERLVSRTPLGHIGDPVNDVGPAAVFLASDLSRHVSGQTIVVDGGGFRGL